MNEVKRYELIDSFVKARAEKYRAIEIRNKCVDRKLELGSTGYSEKEIENVETNINNCNKECLEQEYRLNSFIRNLRIGDLNAFATAVKHYSRDREAEIEKYKEDLNLYGPNLKWEHHLAETKISYYEKYERISIKDLHYVIAREKAEKFGMDRETAKKYASHEIDKLIDIDILADEMPKVRKRD